MDVCIISEYLLPNSYELLRKKRVIDGGDPGIHQVMGTGIKTPKSGTSAMCTEGVHHLHAQSNHEKTPNRPN